MKKFQPAICTATFAKLWIEGVPTREIAETLRLTADQCDSTRRKLGLPRRASWHNARPGKRKPYLPSPEEILRKCAEFQSRWTPEERAARRVGGGSPATTRVIPEAMLRATYNEAVSESSNENLIEDLIRDTSG